MCRDLGRELLVTRERQPSPRKKIEGASLGRASKDLSRAGEGSQERPSHGGKGSQEGPSCGGEHAELAALESLSLDDMPDRPNKQKEFISGLVELPKESLDDMPTELNE